MRSTDREQKWMEQQCASNKSVHHHFAPSVRLELLHCQDEAKRAPVPVKAACGCQFFKLWLQIRIFAKTATINLNLWQTQLVMKEKNVFVHCPRKWLSLCQTRLSKQRLHRWISILNTWGKMAIKTTMLLCLGKQTLATWTNVSSEISARWKPISTAHKLHMITCKPHSTQRWSSGSRERQKDLSLRTGFFRWN